MNTTTWVISRTDNGGPWRIIYTGPNKWKGLYAAHVLGRSWLQSGGVRCETLDEWYARYEKLCAAPDVLFRSDAQRE